MFWLFRTNPASHVAPPSQVQINCIILLMKTGIAMHVTMHTKVEWLDSYFSILLKHLPPPCLNETSVVKSFLRPCLIQTRMNKELRINLVNHER